MKKLLCKLGFHDWTIGKIAIYRNRKNKIGDDIYRECERCEIRQKLERPKYYHPTKYIWVDDLE